MYAFQYYNNNSIDKLSYNFLVLSFLELAYDHHHQVAGLKA